MGLIVLLLLIKGFWIVGLVIFPFYFKIVGQKCVILANFSQVRTFETKNWVQRNIAVFSIGLIVLLLLIKESEVFGL